MMKGYILWPRTVVLPVSLLNISALYILTQYLELKQVFKGNQCFRNDLR